METDQILALYQSVHWTNYTDHPELLAAAIQHSLNTLGAYCGDQLVGLIRLVGDGFSIIYIQDLLVTPTHQRRGIGRQLIAEVDKLYPHVYQKVLLTDSTSQSVQFYERCGFSQSNAFNCVSFMKFSG